MDVLWIIICGCLIFFMQAGFTCYEAGMVQSRNVISVSIENLLNLMVTILVFGMIGFPLMFGESVGEIFGNGFWFLTGLDQLRQGSDYGYAYAFMAIMFAAVSVTIFAGSMSERTKLLPLVISAIVAAGLIYPVYGHWVWGGALTGNAGWLEKLGFMDYAGAAVVHMTAGCIALAGSIIVGPRKEVATKSSNIPLSVLGIFILWFGWLGFNGGCTTPGADGFSLVFINTSLAAAAGMAGALIVNLLVSRKSSYLESIFRGVLGGLVSITASSIYCSPGAAIAVGFLAGVATDFFSQLLVKCKIDDAVSAVPAHLIGGLFGILTLPFVITDGTYKAGGLAAQAGIQCVGALVCIIWGTGIALIMFIILKKTIGLRVSLEEEQQGLNIVEFNDIYSWEKYMENTGYQQEIHEKNRLLRKQARLLAATEEKEKQRIARDLHDGLGQNLSALKLLLKMNRKQAESTGDTKAIESASKASELADTSIAEMRGVLNNLQPEILRKEGLAGGIKAMADSLNSTGALLCTFDEVDPIPDYDDAIGLNIYRMVQEALNNAVKHSGADTISITGRNTTDNNYVFIIKDNGCGFNLSEVKVRDKSESGGNGLGLGSMSERLAMLSGRLVINSEPGKGTEIVIEVPVRE